MSNDFVPHSYKPCQHGNGQDHALQTLDHDSNETPPLGWKIICIILWIHCCSLTKKVAKGMHVHQFHTCEFWNQQGPAVRVTPSECRTASVRCRHNIDEYSPQAQRSHSSCTIPSGPFAVVIVVANKKLVRHV
jgi:hypothetical protein